MKCVFETIISTIEPPKCDENGPMQMLVSNIDYDDYVGRIAVGRVERGVIKEGMSAVVCKADKQENAKVVKVSTYVGLKKVEVEEAKAGDIVEISGIPNIKYRRNNL
jgi:Predicted membrane GTPase involved in stress response